MPGARGEKQVVTRRRFLGLLAAGGLGALWRGAWAGVPSGDHAWLESLIHDGRVQLYFRLQGPYWRENVTDYIDGQPYKRLVPRFPIAFRGYEAGGGSSEKEPTAKIGVVWCWETWRGGRLEALDDAVYMSLWRRPEWVTVELAKLDAGPAEHMLVLDGEVHRIRWETEHGDPVYRRWRMQT